jgi:hypothetical protein
MYQDVIWVDSELVASTLKSTNEDLRQAVATLNDMTGYTWEDPRSKEVRPLTPVQRNLQPDIGIFSPDILTPQEKVACLMVRSRCKRVEQGTSQALRLSTGFPYKVLSLCTEPDGTFTMQGCGRLALIRCVPPSQVLCLSTGFQYKCFFTVWPACICMPSNIFLNSGVSPTVLWPPLGGAVGHLWALWCVFGGELGNKVLCKYCAKVLISRAKYRP